MFPAPTFLPGAAAAASVPPACRHPVTAAALPGRQSHGPPRRRSRAVRSVRPANSTSQDVIECPRAEEGDRQYRSREEGSIACMSWARPLAHPQTQAPQPLRALFSPRGGAGTPLAASRIRLAGGALPRGGADCSPSTRQRPTPGLRRRPWRGSRRNQRARSQSRRCCEQPVGTWRWRGTTPGSAATRVTFKAPGDSDLDVERRDWDDSYPPDLSA